MQVGDRQGREPSGKQFSFAVIEEGRPTPHLLKVRLLFFYIPFYPIMTRG